MPEQHIPDWTCTCGAQHANAQDLLEHMDNCPDWEASKPAKCGHRRDTPPL